MKILMNKRQNFISDDALAGAFAGAVARLISAPFDVQKNNRPCWRIFNCIGIGAENPISDAIHSVR